MKIKVYILFILFLTIGEASSWSMKHNRHGIVLKSAKSTLYLGKDCDAISTRYGNGVWGWDTEKVSVVFNNKRYSLNIGLVYPQSKCYNRKIVNRNYDSQHIEVVIPHDKCALIVASRKTKKDVRDYIDENITSTRYLNIYKSNNGWYAISIGFLKEYQKNSILKNWKKIGKIPSDSLCSKGSRYLYEVSPNIETQKTLSKKIGIYKNSNESTYSTRARTKDRTLICLAKTWGPDVCSQKFNEFAKEKMNTEVNDMINSPVCATLISEALNEPVSQADVNVAILTGFLDEAGNSGVKSDNIFYNIAGGLSYMYSFAIKVSLYDECMTQ